MTTAQKASATLGWLSRGTLAENYQRKILKAAKGIDFEATDGLGNKIEVIVREAPNGFRIVLNGEEIASSFS